MANDEERDFLDELIAEGAARNPDFPAMVEAARARHQAERRDADARRERLGLATEGETHEAGRAGRAIPRAKQQYGRSSRYSSGGDH